jgi:AraC family transcriptional regulator
MSTYCSNASTPWLRGVKNGYKLDYSNFYWSEGYTYERYCKPTDNGKEELILDWYMPCIKVG